MTRKLMTRREAARYLTEEGFPCAPATLAKYACQGGGPVFVRFGLKPLYRPDDLIDWAVGRSRRCTSTSDAGQIMAPESPTAAEAASIAGPPTPGVPLCDRCRRAARSARGEGGAE